ncbi:MAG: hypothetical protein ACFFCD_17930 [Promethearchaeota archaeon]
MLKKYKNEIYQILKEAPFDINFFEGKEEKVKDIFNVVHNAFIVVLKDTPMRFTIMNSPTDFNEFKYSYTQFTPNYTQKAPLFSYSGIVEVKKELISWLEKHVQLYFDEMEEPDLWDEFVSREKVLDLGAIDFQNQEYFNEDEKKQIQLALNDAKLLIINQFQPNDAEMKSIDDRLDYLVNAADRLNKFDWKSLLISMIMSISIALSLDTENGKALFEIFKQVLDIIPKLFLPH